MKAIGITPHQAHTARMVELPQPQLDDIPDGRGVLVRVLQVGVDGTDKELHLGEYGDAPDGYDFLVPGRDNIPFYEYFHGDNGAGLGASHQTGWTTLVAKLIQQSGG